LGLRGERLHGLLELAGVLSDEGGGDEQEDGQTGERTKAHENSLGWAPVGDAE